MDHNIEERKDLALAAFRGFDLDGNGTITSMEMGRVIWRSVLPVKEDDFQTHIGVIRCNED